MWSFKTLHGTFAIKPENNGWQLWLNDMKLGWHHSEASALDNLLSGSTPLPDHVEVSELDIPDDLSEWNFAASASG